MDDVNTDNLQDGDSLIWDNEQGKWVPGSSGGGGNGGVIPLIFGWREGRSYSTDIWWRKGRRYSTDIWCR